MKIRGALIKEQGITFAIVLVKQSAIQTAYEADKTRKEFQSLFPNFPLILASQDARGSFKYQGRRDLVNFLASINPARIPWKEYSISL